MNDSGSDLDVATPSKKVKAEAEAEAEAEDKFEDAASAFDAVKEDEKETS